ncbi:MAG: DUF58 domain-containing protein [Bacteroidetes bacterium]|nr:DUF58 domain-containing protein [Bacteroidota bacterium]
MIRRLLYRFDLFLSKRLFWLLAALVIAFILSYPFGWLLAPARVALIALAIVTLTDGLLIFLFANPIKVERFTTEKWSLGDENSVRIELKNRFPLPWYVHIADELPFQLQERNFLIRQWLLPLAKKTVPYTVKPLSRGEYGFGAIRVLLHSPLGLLARRITTPAEETVAVFPSIIQMKKYSIYTSQRLAQYYGVKKIRRLGLSFEFEQIKDYVAGDDIRHINWKATGRTASLKTNHFIEEKSQPVYCVIDKSRVMNLAFNGLTLLDYSINASLVIANTALQKGDRAGLIAFSDKMGAALRADNSPGQLRRIMDALYNQSYRETEADYEFLYNATRRITGSRSLLFLFTHFESMYALQRVLPVLRKLNKSHLLIVIFFSNSEVESYAYAPSENMKEIYNRMIARQMVADLRQMAIELNNHGIQCIVTKPQDLTISTLNKYLELKAKGIV